MKFQPQHRMTLAAFLLDFAVSCGLVATPFLAMATLKAGPGLTGTVGAMQMALYAVGCLLSAYFVRERQLGLGWAIGGVSAFALLYALLPAIGATAYFGIIATVPFLGLALAWPAMQVWVGNEQDPAVRARSLSWFNTATAFGFTVSPLVVGPLFDFDVRAPFAGLLVIGTMVIALLVTLPSGTARSGQDPAKGDPNSAQPAEHLSLGLLYASWCATCTANAMVTTVRSIYPKRIESLVSAHQLTLIGNYRPDWLESAGIATTFSWLAFLLSLATVVCFFIMGRTTAWHRRFSWIVFGQIAAGCSFTLLGSVQSLGLLLFCFAVQGVNFGLSFFASLYYSLMLSAKSHRRAAINEGALGAGGLIGGAGVGYLAEQIGVERAFYWAPAGLVIALLAQVWLLQRFSAQDA